MQTITGEVGNLIIERRRLQYYLYLKQRPIRMQELLEMDASGDGKVSLLEYVEFMLKSLEKVDDELLDDIKQQFDKLDATRDGYITKYDLRQTVKKSWTKACHTVNVIHALKMKAGANV